MGESERLSIEEIRELLQRVEIPNDVLLHRRALRDLLALYDEEHERAERAEAERDRLQAEVERLTGLIAHTCDCCVNYAVGHYCIYHSGLRANSETCEEWELSHD